MTRKISILAVAVFSVALTAAIANIALTIPEEVRSEVGGTATITYDEIRTTQICVRPDNSTVAVQFELFDVQDAARPPFFGTYNLDTDAATADFTIEGLGIFLGKTLTGPQVDGVNDFIVAHVATVEQSMIDFGVVDGTQQ